MSYVEGVPQPAIRNIPFNRKTKHKAGITIAMAMEIFDYNKWPIIYPERHDAFDDDPYESEIFSDLSRSKNIKIPPHLWRFFLCNIFVQLPAGRKLPNGNWTSYM